MKFPALNFEEPNQQLFWILAIGIALGIGNYALGIWPTLEQSITQQLVISFIVGYGLLFVVFNRGVWFNSSTSEPKRYSILILVFALIGILGSEVEELIKAYVFQQTTYSFLLFKGTHLFNSILCVILGFVTLNWAKKSKGIEPSKKTEPSKDTLKQLDLKKETKEALTAIPIRKGENILLHPILEILFFEAYDNYAFLYDLEGKKHLCNYSLLFLGKKLKPNFLRVHRKYLVNKEQIAQIKPHLKGRFVIEFKDKNKTTITSSTSYTDVIKSLTKL